GCPGEVIGVPGDEGRVQAASAEVERCRLAVRDAAGSPPAAPLSQELAHALWVHNEALMAEERLEEAFVGAKELVALLRSAPVPDEPLTARALTRLRRR